MKVLEDIIAEAIGLEVDGMNFYRDRKVWDKVAIKFAWIAKERKPLVKISNSYFFLISYLNFRDLLYLH